TRSYGDWSSDVCSSDLDDSRAAGTALARATPGLARGDPTRFRPVPRKGSQPALSKHQRARHCALSIRTTSSTTLGRTLQSSLERSEERRVGKECSYRSR